MGFPRNVSARPPVNSLLSDAPPIDCPAVSRRGKCALEVIDGLLGLPRAAVSGEEVDLLLDLRWQLRRRTEAEAALRLFCDLRRRMEKRHYLAFFRLRRWLENQVLAEVRVCPAAEVRVEKVKLDYYCVEAVRRVCLCASLGRGTFLLAPRLRFRFRVETVVAPGMSPGEPR